MRFGGGGYAARGAWACGRWVGVAGAVCAFAACADSVDDAPYRQYRPEEPPEVAWLFAAGWHLWRYSYSKYFHVCRHVAERALETLLAVLFDMHVYIGS